MQDNWFGEAREALGVAPISSVKFGFVSSANELGGARALLAAPDVALLDGVHDGNGTWSATVTATEAGFKLLTVMIDGVAAQESPTVIEVQVPVCAGYNAFPDASGMCKCPAGLVPTGPSGDCRPAPVSQDLSGWAIAIIVVLCVAVGVAAAALLFRHNRRAAAGGAALGGESVSKFVITIDELHRPSSTDAAQPLGATQAGAPSSSSVESAIVIQQTAAGFGAHGGAPAVLFRGSRVVVEAAEGALGGAARGSAAAENSAHRGGAGGPGGSTRRVSSCRESTGSLAGTVRSERRSSGRRSGFLSDILLRRRVAGRESGSSAGAPGRLAPQAAGLRASANLDTVKAAVPWEHTNLLDLCARYRHPHVTTIFGGLNLHGELFTIRELGHMGRLDVVLMKVRRLPACLAHCTCTTCCCTCCCVSPACTIKTPAWHPPPGGYLDVRKPSSDPDGHRRRVPLPSR